MWARKLRGFMVAIALGCSLAVTGCAPLDDESAAEAVEETPAEPAAPEVSSESFGLEDNEGRRCRRSRDCRGGTSTFCCAGRCTVPVPGMICLREGAGSSPE